MAATWTVEPLNAYLDCLTGRSTYNSYEITAYSFSLQTSASVDLAYFQPPMTWVVTAGTATLTATNIAVNATGTIAKAGIAGGYFLSGPVTLAGGGGMIVVSNLNVTNGGVLASATINFVMPRNNGGTLRINTALATAWANSILNNTDHPAMANGGTLDIYSGTQPATADTAPSGTKLWSVTLATTDFTDAVSGAVSLSGSKSANAIASGTATWARWTKGALVLDGSVGTTGTDFVLNAVGMTSGSSYTLTAATLSLG